MDIVDGHIADLQRMDTQLALVIRHVSYECSLCFLYSSCSSFFTKSSVAVRYLSSISTKLLFEGIFISLSMTRSRHEKG